ncbi:MAG: hypothetical protein LBU45_03855 [Azoarcus sp.]|jgi:hypothetical protein|nr:hypothetical protein [Azoarcus sp.]
MLSQALGKKKPERATRGQETLLSLQAAGRARANVGQQPGQCYFSHFSPRLSCAGKANVVLEKNHISALILHNLLLAREKWHDYSC